ncbi:beta-galactosidase [Lachnospiraceae bacterium OttesenSCG-928-D06]|nr:beta-galactosidase [Lachnospiraceae bacterium OttesenSCG-928-D06]
MIMKPGLNKVMYGGDYNPEQWSEVEWEEDMRLLGEANMNMVTLNVFNWAMLQPDEITYRFEALDETVRRVKANGMFICMATATGAHPAWMARKYPDVLRTEFNGMRRKFGGRHNSCPNSPNFRRFAAGIVEEIARRYQKEEAIVAWHVSNEYGGACYCENCEKAFRLWLEKKYGTLDTLNHAWNTSFWGHTFYSWDDIVAPNMLSEHFAENFTMQQSISLDYARFNSDSMLENYRMEHDILKRYTPDIPITTNMMGLYKQLDYQAWAPYLDFISWDNYPQNDHSPARIALNHDLMRGLKGGKPFALMEQTPSVSNWLPQCSLKRPGVMRLWSYQAMAHGADTVQFFQIRRSPGSCEKYHGAVIDHVGHGNTRVFKECAALGKELAELKGQTLGGYTKAKVGILFDWNNWWAIEYSAGPTRELKYVDEVLNYYTAFHQHNISVDLIGCEADLSKYSLVIAPVLYMVKPGVDESIKSYVKNGGHFLTTFFSGYVDENDRVTIGGYPGKLRELLGIWVEEIDALEPGMENSFAYKDAVYPARTVCDLLHLEGAEALSVYEKDFYAGMPVLTRNQFGEGYAYYVATQSNEDFYGSFLSEICENLDIQPVLKTPDKVEVTCRERDGMEILYLLNHGEESAEITLPFEATNLFNGKEYNALDSCTLPPKDVLLLKKQS